VIRRLGVIGDLHGEHERLARVLEWFSGQQLDALVCTGDVADGRGCINESCHLLQQANVATVSGNHDRWLLEDRVRHVADAHSIDEVSEDNLAFLKSLPRSRSFETSHGSLLLCHGVADNDLGKVWPGTSRSRVERSDDLDDLIAAGRHRFLVNGHLHYRVLIDFHDLLLLNAGTLKGQYSGITIMDFEADAVTAYEVADAGPPQRVREHAMLDSSPRRRFRNTAEFDGGWEPVTLYRQAI